MFKNAKFIVSKVEWEYAFKPDFHQRRLYKTFLFDRTAVNYFDWEFVEAENQELYPGLRLLYTPGHTPGHMSVLVKTNKGTVCFAGDVCPTAENLRNNIISNVVVDPVKMLDSYDHIRWTSDFVIPGHEPNIYQFQADGFPECSLESFY